MVKKGDKFVKAKIEYKVLEVNGEMALCQIGDMLTGTLREVTIKELLKMKKL